MSNVPVNRFKFIDRHGRTIHCVIVERPRANARVICATENGATMRVPGHMLKHVPEGSPITEKRAEALLSSSRQLVQHNRGVQRQRRAERAAANARLDALLDRELRSAGAGPELDVLKKAGLW